MNRIDQETSTKIRMVMELAKLRGADVVSLLDRAGYLRHDARVLQDRVDLLDAWIDSWRDTPADKIHGAKLPKTMLDLKNLMILMLEDMRDRLVNNRDSA